MKVRHRTFQPRSQRVRPVRHSPPSERHKVRRGRVREFTHDPRARRRRSSDLWRVGRRRKTSFYRIHTRASVLLQPRDEKVAPAELHRMLRGRVLVRPPARRQRRRWLRRGQALPHGQLRGHSRRGEAKVAAEYGRELCFF